MNVAIVDYGMGNIRSIASALKYVGVDNVVVTAEYERLKQADALILPGVGAFGKAMSKMKEINLDKYLGELVLTNRKPILGICLGMQLLGMSSDENGQNTGLGLIKGNVRKFAASNVKIPHVGFDQVKINKTAKLYKGFPECADFYFTHSFRMLSEYNINQSLCNYGEEFIASFESGNIVGVQFHPELSQHNGLNLIRNFIGNF